MTHPRVLVAGIGNIFLSDDGFGVEVANRLLASPAAEGVRVAEFGIRGVHLAYELLDGYDALVLIDAVPMNEPPGTLAVIEPDDVPLPDAGDDVGPVLDAHTMHPAVVLGMLAGLGGSVDRIVIIGCQPASLDEGIGLSPTVAAAVGPAVALCGQVLADIVQPVVQPVGKETTG